MSSASEHESVSESEDCAADENSAELDTIGNEVEKSSILDAFLKKSSFLADLQDDLEKLSSVVKKRVNALKNLQLQATCLEAKFYEEIHLLECKYSELYQPFHEKRRDIVLGRYEPTAEECEWKLDSESAEEISKQLKDKVVMDDTAAKTNESSKENEPIGIPRFWLTTLQNVTMVTELIQPHDEPILAHLIDIKTILLENPMGFILEFYFEPNEYFSNKVLTKEYEMKCVPDPSDPFSFEGPEIVKCKGCKIDWKAGKNVTIKQIKKKMKLKNRGPARTITKTVQNESFFNFFNPPEVPEDPKSESYDDVQELLTTDFEIGHYIRERVVPNAVLFFSGDAVDEDYDEEEEEEDEDDEDEDDSELDTVKEGPTKKVSEKRRENHDFSSKSTKAALAGKGANAVSDCKQQ